MTGERLLTVPEVAEYLRVSAESVRRWLREGRLRGIRPGGTKIGWRILQAEVDRFVREGGTGPSGIRRQIEKGGPADVTPNAELPTSSDTSG